MPTISPSLADFLYDVANVFVIAGAAAALLGALGTIWMGSVKERYSDQRMAANEAQTATANAQAALAGEGAARANERAATLEKSAEEARLAQEQIREENLKLALTLEQERTARLVTEERVLAQGEQVKKLMPRRLTVDQRTRIAKSIASMKGTISVAHDIAAADAKPLSNEIADLFQIHGWNVLTPSILGLGSHAGTWNSDHSS